LQIKVIVSYNQNMDPHRKAWNDRHKELRYALEKSRDLEKAIELFLIQHGMVHSAELSESSMFSFEDEILNDLKPDKFRIIPENSNHSIAWIIWHLARIEDVTMNVLVADTSQILHRNSWLKRLHIGVPNTGNGMSDREVRILSDRIDIKALRQYRLEVGRETRKIVAKIKPTELNRKTEPSRIQRVWDEKAMLPGGNRVINYWATRTISGLLLMPATRHNILHLNEARQIKSKVMKL
jgi:hypothetical protein